MRYFIVELSDPNLDAIFDVCIQTIEKARPSLDDLLRVVSLPLDYVGLPTCLEGITEYSDSEISTEMDGPNWSEEYEA